MTQPTRKVEINLAAIPVSGFGGMCMVVASLVCAVALPPTRWFMLAGIATGVVFGFAMILMRRMGDSAPSGDAGHPLGIEAAASSGRPRRGHTTLGRLRLAQI